MLASVMSKPRKEDRELLTDFYIWMVKNDYSHNIRIRVETKAELFLREKIKNKDAVLYSVVCSCDGCSKQFEYKKVKTQMEVVMNLPQIGEYAVCDDCKKKGLEFE